MDRTTDDAYRRLTALGYPCDGGIDTAGRIAAYQTSRGLPASGRLDEGTLSELFAPAAGPSAPSAPPGPKPPTPKQTTKGRGSPKEHHG